MKKTASKDRDFRRNRIERLLKLWEEHSAITSGWRGIGDCHGSDSLICFMERDSEFAPLKNRANNEGIEVEPLFIYDLPSSSSKSSPCDFQSLQPGSQISASETGTLG